MHVQTICTISETAGVLYVGCSLANAAEEEAIVAPWRSRRAPRRGCIPLLQPKAGNQDGDRHQRTPPMAPKHLLHDGGGDAIFCGDTGCRVPASSRRLDRPASGSALR